MNNENSPLDSLARDFDIESGDGSQDVGNSSLLSLEEVNRITGREYKDKDTALKALSETYKMVGKAGKIERENLDLKTKYDDVLSKLGTIDELKTEMFYQSQPQYAPYRAIISKMGGNPGEVVATDEFKKVFDGLSEVEKIKSAKSVLESNPRIGQAKTKLDEAKDLSLRGQQSSANESAVAAVMEAYGEN